MSEYLKQKKLEVTEKSYADSSQSFEITVPIKISHGDDQVTGEGAIIIDWKYVDYVDDIQVKGENVEGYAVRKFDSTMKTAVIDVKGTFKNDNTKQVVIKYGKKVDKFGVRRL